MTIKQILTNDMKTAMKARDMTSLGIIRLMLSQIKNFEIDNGEQDDAGIQKLITKEIKQLTEAADEYEKAGRVETATEEREKIAVLKKYLPEQMSDQELEKIVDEVIYSQDKPQMGPVIGEVKKRTRGQADGSRIAELVKSKI